MMTSFYNKDNKHVVISPKKDKVLLEYDTQMKYLSEGATEPDIGKEWIMYNEDEGYVLFRSKLTFIGLDDGYYSDSWIRLSDKELLQRLLSRISFDDVIEKLGKEFVFKVIGIKTLGTEKNFHIFLEKCECYGHIYCEAKETAEKIGEFITEGVYKYRKDWAEWDRGGYYIENLKEEEI